MNTGNFNGKESPAPGVNTTPSTAGIPPCGNVNGSEKNTEKDTIRTSNAGTENSFSDSVEKDIFEPGKNKNLGYDATTESPVETVDLKSSTSLENTSSHVVHTQQICNSTEDLDTNFSNVAGQDVVEKILDQWDIESFESKEHFEKNTAISLSLKQDVHNDAVVEKEMRIGFGGGSVLDCEKQNKILDDALVLGCQSVAEEDINQLSSGPSGTSLESNIDTDCTKEIQLVDAGTTAEGKTELQSNQQVYSLDSIKIELSNVKNCLNEANPCDEDKDEESESSDLEESSGTTTTSTESDDEASSSSSTDSEEVVSRRIAAVMEEEEDGVHQAPPKTRDEILFQELPAEPELDVKLDEKTKLVEIGEVTSVVESLLVIKTVRQVPALDVDTVLFLEDRNVLGKVCEIFGPVQSPYYAIRYNSKVEAKAKNVKHGEKVFYCPDMTDLTKFVFTAQLRKMKGSDASWKFDQEPPEELVEYSDDEEEKEAKTKKRREKKSQNQGKKGHADQAKKLGSHFPKQSKGFTKDLTPVEQSPQASFQALPPPQLQRPPYSGGFGHPSLRPGQYPRAPIPGGVFRPGHFSGPPQGYFMRTPQQVPRGGQFWPRPMQHCGPRGPAPGFNQINPGFVIKTERPDPGFVVTAERPLGNQLPVSQQSRQLLRAPLNRPPPNVQESSSSILHLERCFLHGVNTPNQCPPEIRFRRPVVLQGTFEGVILPRPPSMVNTGQQSDERAAFYMPPPPPPNTP